MKLFSAAYFNLNVLWALLLSMFALAAPLSLRAQVLVPVTAEKLSTSVRLEHNLSLSEQARAAESAYINGRYQEAAGLYEKLAEQASFDPTVLYNLATAYAKTGQKGLAIWRYLQALKLKPRDGDTLHNLSVLGYNPESALPFPLDKLSDTLTGNEWTIAAGVVMLIAVILFAISFMMTRGTEKRRAMRNAAWIFGILAILAWPFAIGHYYRDEIAKHGVIVAEDSVMRTGPSESQVSTYGLAPGSVVRIREHRNDGWLKISFGTGYIGYIEAQRVRNI